MISQAWFPVDQRATATAVMTTMNYMGTALAFLLGPLMVPEDSGHE
jgi:FLVCR family MFS transporter